MNTNKREHNTTHLRKDKVRIRILLPFLIKTLFYLLSFRVGISDRGALNGLINNANSKMRRFPQVKKDILKDITDVIVKEENRRVHVITGKTKRSIYAKILDENNAEVGAFYGAKWEEKRGAPHDFKTQAAEIARIEGARYAQNRLNIWIRS